MMGQIMHKYWKKYKDTDISISRCGRIIDIKKLTTLDTEITCVQCKHWAMYDRDNEGRERM